MRLILIGPTATTETAVTQALHAEPWIVDTAADLAMARSKLRWVDLICLVADSEVDTVLERIHRIQDMIPSTRIIVLLNHDSPETRARIIDSGADDCISLPISSDELRARIAAVARR